MKLKVNQPAPDFTVSDVWGNEVALRKLKGNKIYLVFERNVGCPVCNLHFHELVTHAKVFSEHNIKVILVYESARENLQTYLDGVNAPFYFVADPDNTMYSRYSVDRSFAKLMKGVAHGLLSKAKAGTKLFTKPMKQDGHITTVPAEFVIDGEGMLSVVHYGNYLGDHLSLSSIKKFLF